MNMIMNKDFRNYAVKHLGLDSRTLDDVVSAQNQYLNPYILEERQLNVPDGRVLPLDDGPHHLLGHANR